MRIWLMAVSRGDKNDKRILRHYNILYTLEKKFGIQSAMYVEGFSLVPSNNKMVDLESKIFYAPTITPKNPRFKKIVKLLNLIIFFFASLISFCIHKEARKSDFIWAVVPHPGVGLAAWLLCTLFNKKLIYEIADPWPELLIELGYFKEDSWFSRFLKKIDLVLQKKASSIILFSTQDYFVADAYKAKIKLIKNGIPDYAYQASQVNKSKSADVTKFVFAGGCANAFKMDLMLEACHIVKEKAPHLPFHFQVMTNEPEVRKFSPLIETFGIAKEVSMQFKVPYQEMIDTICASDYYLLHVTDKPVFRKGINSNKLMDAFATLTPVVFAANIEKNHVLVSGAGFNCLPDNANTLADAMIQALQVNDTAYIALKQKMKAYVEQELSVEQQIYPLLKDFGIA